MRNVKNIELFHNFLSLKLPQIFNEKYWKTIKLGFKFIILTLLLCMRWMIMFTSILIYSFKQFFCSLDFMKYIFWTLTAKIARSVPTSTLTQFFCIYFSSQSFCILFQKIKFYWIFWNAFDAVNFSEIVGFCLWFQTRSYCLSLFRGRGVYLGFY